jgi:hypothetical protein
LQPRSLNQNTNHPLTLNIDNTTEEKLTATSDLPNMNNINNITEDVIITTFDQLVTEGVLVYGPYESMKFTDYGYPVSKCMKLAIKQPTRPIPH